MINDGTVAGAPNQGYHPSAGHPPSWCVCTHCREMPTMEERRCCGKTARCTTHDHHWYFLLDPFNISLHNGFRNDLLGDMEDGNYNKCLRHGSYRLYMWIHNKLTAGDRRVIPSCCVWKIRDSFPDPFGQYTGLKPNKFA